MPVEPGVPVAQFLTVPWCTGIAFICQACTWRRLVPLEAAIVHLHALGLDPETTGIRSLCHHVRLPCGRCGGLAFEVRPHYRGMPGRDGLTPAA